MSEDTVPGARAPDRRSQVRANHPPRPPGEDDRADRTRVGHCLRMREFGRSSSANRTVRAWRGIGTAYQEFGATGRRDISDAVFPGISETERAVARAEGVKRASRSPQFDVRSAARRAAPLRAGERLSRARVCPSRGVHLALLPSFFFLLSFFTAASAGPRALGRAIRWSDGSARGAPIQKLFSEANSK